MSSNFYCPGDLTLLNTFDLSYAPTLLFYSYIPIVIACLFLTLFVLFKNRFSLESKLLFLIAVSFSFWVLNIILQWITVPVNLNYFEWQITPFLEILIPVFSLYFVSVFLEKRDIKTVMKIFLAVVVLAVSISIPFSFNSYSFDVINCEANLGPLIYYVYGFEVFSILYVLYICIRKYISASDAMLKKQIIYLMLGVMFFLGVFSVGQSLGEITKVYEINLIGPIGMALFIGMLTYLIVKFQAFNIRLIGAQALVISIIGLIGSQFFFIQNPTNRILNSVTFVLVIIFGYFLVRSVHKEVTSKRKIEMLNEQLESLIHFISHEIKGYLTKDKAVFSVIIDGDYGEVSPELKKLAESALKGTKEGVETVMSILDSSNIKKGINKFNMAPFDLKSALVEETVSELKENAEAKNLIMEAHIDEGQDYTIVGDREMLAKHVVRNLIDNSIRYTPSGRIDIGLSKNNGKIVLSVKDTGVGISEEDKARLFTEGGRGKDSTKINISSTGYGLFFAKGIIDAHGGRIWAESEGRGKGSVFYVELPERSKVSLPAQSEYEPSV